ncbi:MAG TPA: YkgJ family cysteine cluster protein [Acidobacteriota bacterium]|nr:YkgJ family cysteine cluster protein [Acidobacteriota bacterium]
MRCLRCGACCKETEMLLSTEDIERLERKGYSKEFFVRFDSEGYAKLRNLQDHCVFYDAEKQRCKVYTDRPLGCRLYPVIYDETKGIVVDSICQAQGNWNEKKIERKGKKVAKLLEKIDAEAKRRRSA